jgi:hypothetical protein
MSLFELERGFDEMFSRMFAQYCDNNFSNKGLREMFYYSSGFVLGYEWYKSLHTNPMNVRWFAQLDLFDARFVGFCVEICDKPMNDVQFENMLKIQLEEQMYGSASRDELKYYKKNKRHKRWRSRRRSQRRDETNEKEKESKPNDYIVIRDDNIIGAICYLERQIYKHILSDPTILKKLTKIERLNTELNNRRTYNLTQFRYKCVLKYLKHFIQCDVIADVCTEYLFIFFYKKTYK